MSPKPKSWKQVKEAAAVRRRLTPQAASGSAFALLSNPNITVTDHKGKLIRNDGKQPAGLRSRHVRQTSHLLTFLPDHLRTRIFKLVLRGTEIEIPKRSRKNRTGRYQAPGILMASRKVLEETNKMFYEGTIFTIRKEAAYRLTEWLKKVEPKRRSWLKEVRFSILPSAGEPGEGPAMQLLNQAKRGEAMLKYHARVHGLAEGILKTDLKVEGTMWTAKPEAVVEEVLSCARWEAASGWQWMKEPREELRGLILQK